MAEAVSSHEFLRQHGSTFVVFHPSGEQLVLGLGCSEQPAVVPACVAYRRKLGSDQQLNARSAAVGQLPSPTWPHQQAYEALKQVHRSLHLSAPPAPPTLQQQPGTQPHGHADAAFLAAKAGLVSQKQVPEGSDGFIWQQQQSTTRQLPCFAGGQVPALWPPDEYEAHWLMTPDNHIAGMDTTPQHILLDRFEATWGWALQQLGLSRPRCRHLSAVLAVPINMTAAEVRLLADLLLGRLGFVALVVHLEPIAACFGNGTTSACVINIGSSSCSVCCVDDAVVLPPLASRFSLPVGLVDMAGALTGWMACYGHWPTQLQQQGLGHSISGSSSSNSSAAAGSVSAELADAGSEQGASPAAAASAAAASSSAAAVAGGGPGVACSRHAGAVSPASVYNVLLLEDLVLQQCYFPKENYQPGLLGQPMLEDQPPAVVPARTPGQPTTNYSVSLGSWAAAATMALFHPDMAPPGFGAASLNPGQQIGSASLALGTPVKQEHPQDAGSNGSPAATTPATAPPTPPPAAAGGASPLAADEPQPGWQYQRHHAGVLELPAAEALHFQSQLKARLEAGEAGAPPDGMYLLPIELADKPVGVAPGAAASGGAAGGGGSGTAAAAAAAGGGTPTPGPAAQRAADAAHANVPTASPSGQKPAAAAAAAAAGSSQAGSRGSEAVAAVGLDEAVFRSIKAASTGRPELMSRLAAGLLLMGPGGGVRGLGSALERRLGQRFSKARMPQVVSTLEPRAEAAHVAWKGAALLAALDSGRENWLPRHQWVDGGMVLPTPLAPKGPAGAAAASPAGGGKKAAAAGASAAGAGGSGGAAGAAGTGSNSTTAAGRHTKLFYYCRAEQGML